MNIFPFDSGQLAYITIVISKEIVLICIRDFHSAGGPLTVNKSNNFDIKN